MAYRAWVRLQRACFLLRDCNLRISEVAMRVGYEDAGYFSRHFKKRFGLSPRQVREHFLRDTEL
jgi:AraC-like DNA-binding protein